MSTKKPPSGILAVLPAISFLALLYLNTAFLFTHAKIYYDHNNLFFSADHLEAIQGWIPFHKGVHPLILLFVLPLTHLIQWITNDPVSSALVVNSGFGVCTCLFAYFAFWKLTDSIFDSVLYTMFFGLTGSQWIFSAVPDSYSLAAFSIVFSFFLLIFCIKNQKRYFIWWIFAGILTFGVTITNFGTTLICFLAAMIGTDSNKKFVRVLLYFCLVLVIVTGLNFAQFHLYPGSKLWYQPAEFSYEAQYMNFAAIIQNPTKTIAEVIKNFFVFNVELGQPALVVLKRDGMGWSFYNQFRLLWPWGIPAFVSWISILGFGLIEKSSQYIKRPLFWSCCFTIFWNLGIHLFYGTNEIFLYSGHFTFSVILLSMWWNVHANWKRRLILIATIIFTALNNFFVLANIFRVNLTL
jgi:hypothetical protein